MAAVAAASKHSVVIGINPRPVLAMFEGQVDVVLLMFMPGLECGHALADILFGDVNPSGWLPVTIPARENQIGFTTEQWPGISS